MVKKTHGEITANQTFHTDFDQLYLMNMSSLSYSAHQDKITFNQLHRCVNLRDMSQQDQKQIIICVVTLLSKA